MNFVINLLKQSMQQSSLQNNYKIKLLSFFLLDPNRKPLSKAKRL